MIIIEITILTLYAAGLLFVLLYSIEQVGLAVKFRKNKQNLTPSVLSDSSLPKVTVQLPVYNEKYVVKRLLQSVCALHYPNHLLEIQILDDSTDETSGIIKKTIALFPHKNISYIHRKNRQGYKAGALKNGLQYAKGELIAIFDADFTPLPDFLLQTVPYFSSPDTGMVQTRWGHRNKNFSLLTRLQAFGLDAHFMVEQSARYLSGAFINFNGTAGIWRKKCIESSGNWQADTLTEDLDLSYRAQLSGWKFVYLPQVETPAELPITVQALKNQQFRWTKGAAECAKKHLKHVLLQKNLSFSTKKSAFFHLLNSSVYLFIFYLAVFSLPVLFIKHRHPEWHLFFDIAAVSLISFLLFGIFYFTAPQNQRGFWWKYPLFLSVTLGLLAHNSLAVLQAFSGKKTPFVRTPKFNTEENPNWLKNSYLSARFSTVVLLELFLFIYSLAGMYYGFSYTDFSFYPFWIMLAFGSGFLLSVHFFQWLPVHFPSLKRQPTNPEAVV